MTTTFPIPPTRRTFVHVLSLGRAVEVEIMEYTYLDGQPAVVVSSIDDLQPKPFFVPGKLYPTARATVLVADVTLALEEGTGPTIPMDYSPEEVNAFFDGMSQADKGLKIHDDLGLYESGRE